MAGELDAYADALVEFKIAAAQLMSYANLIADVGQYMQKHPGHIAFSNPGPGQAASAQMTKTVDASKWPDAAKMQAAINRYQSTQGAMLTAFNNIPTDRRSIVEMPPGQSAPPSD